MALLGKRLAVSLPDSVLEEKDSPREKTAKLGTIARACAIYGVDVIEVFRDTGGAREGAMVRKVLEYLETPQYLRKRLYPLDEDLRFAGVLPPLRVPSHRPSIAMSEVAVGHVREGVANPDGTVDVGLEQSPRLKAKVRPGTRMTVRIDSKNPLTAVQVSKEEVGEYWGYSVEMKSMEGVLSDQRFPLKIATSRKGQPLAAALPRLRPALSAAEGVKMIYGSPTRGLFEIVGSSLPAKAEFVVNLFVDQHTETVRTEEAIFAGLGLVNALSAEKGLSAN